jgi:hypothetical protein
MMNFEEPNANLVSHEFLAVILAGFGDEWVWITNFRNSCVTIHPVQAPSPNK